MQDHALVAGRQLEQLADLLGVEALDVAQRQHRLLGRRKRGDRRAQVLARLERREPALGILPRPRRRRPVPRPGVALALEAVRRNGGPLVAGARKRRERHRAPLTHAAGLGLIGEDVKQPRLERRALLKAIERADDRKPRLLHDVLGDRVGAHVRARHALEARVVARDEGHERLLVAGAQRGEERSVPIPGARCGGPRCGGRYGRHVHPPSSEPALRYTVVLRGLDHELGARVRSSASRTASPWTASAASVGWWCSWRQTAAGIRASSAWSAWRKASEKVGNGWM